MAGGSAAGTQQAVLWGGADQPTVASHSSALQEAVSRAGEEGMRESWRQRAGERTGKEGRKIA